MYDSVTETVILEFDQPMDEGSFIATPANVQADSLGNNMRAQDAGSWLDATHVSFAMQLLGEDVPLNTTRCADTTGLQSIAGGGGQADTWDEFPLTTI